MNFRPCIAAIPFVSSIVLTVAPPASADTPQGTLLGGNAIFWNNQGTNELQVVTAPACPTGPGGVPTNVFWSQNAFTYGSALPYSTLNYSPTGSHVLPDLATLLNASAKIFPTTPVIHIDGTPPLCQDGTAAPQYTPNGYGDSQLLASDSTRSCTSTRSTSGMRIPTTLARSPEYPPSTTRRVERIGPG